MITAEKQRLRNRAGDFLRRMGSDQYAVQSKALRVALEGWDKWLGIRSVCIYAALPGEPDLLDPWPAGKVVLLPRVDGEMLSLHVVDGADRLERGAFGIMEPVAGCPVSRPEADVIFVPGLAFDPLGNRLGRGKGFYDRLLEDFQGLRVGVCFEGQMLPAVPCEPHDKRMDFLLTAGGVVPCGT